MRKLGEQGLRDYRNDVGRYIPNEETRSRVMTWEKDQKWFERRNGKSAIWMNAIAQDCGYQGVPSRKFAVMVGEHLRIFYSSDLATKFNVLADEVFSS